MVLHQQQWTTYIGDLPKAFVEQEAKPDAQFILAAFPHGCNSEFRVLMEGCIQNVMPRISVYIRERLVIRPGLVMTRLRYTVII